MNEKEFEKKEKIIVTESPSVTTVRTETRENVRTDSRERVRTTEKAESNVLYSETDLQEVYKNAFTGKESVEILRSFSADKGFRNVLIRQYKEYASLAKEIELYANQAGFDLKKTSFFARSMMYITTAMNTIKDKSDSKLSEIYIQGIDMGIIAMVRLINKLADEGKTLPYAQALLDMLQRNLEEMKAFL